MSKHTTHISEVAVSLILFEIGSTPAFYLGAKAKQDAWLSMAIAAAIGSLLLAIYLAIYRIDPERDLFALCKRCFGKITGTAVALLYGCYFAYEASRNLRDIAEITVLTLLDRTPVFFIALITILVVGNTTRYGPRVLFLTCMALVPVVVCGYMLLVVSIAVSGLLHTSLIFPILENGVRPVWDAAFPEIVSFPFGQMVLFLVFFPLISQKTKINKAIYASYWFIAVFLTIVNQMTILVLGPKLAEKSTIPLFEVVQLIEFAEVIERMDSIFVLLLFVGLGIKMAAFFIGAVAGFSSATSTAYKKWVIPIGVIIFSLSFLSPNYSHHIWLGLKVSVTVNSPVFQMFLPVVMLAVLLFQTHRVKNKSVRGTD